MIRFRRSSFNQLHVLTCLLTPAPHILLDCRVEEALLGCGELSTSAVLDTQRVYNQPVRAS